MTQTTVRNNQAEFQMTAALDRWEGEGGARVSSWALKFGTDALGAGERHILECLGAAMVSSWNELSTDVQRTVFQHAAAGTTYDAVRLKAQIARFLHNHKDGADIRKGCFNS
jgi:hypothetical protein